jgi:hypothetical protein
MRSMSALLGISRLKKATVLPDIATCTAMLPSTAVLPIEGRAPRMVNSFGWNPAVRLSRLPKPEGMPVSLALCSKILSMQG